MKWRVPLVSKTLHGQLTSNEVFLFSWLSQNDPKSTVNIASEQCGDLEQLDCQSYLKTTRALVHVKQAQESSISESILFNIW